MYNYNYERLYIKSGTIILKTESIENTRSVLLSVKYIFI